ncbi:hypothetical protein HU200_016509 [Digitaria exilis]|uniref:VQ domain-containing protein n=1 Tax=Digitaria exilis TaxID=1010633 RepID=A0A835KJS1_9POAL|nr:hypothetical protein HU200_016509 [Digitaria exilis]
MLTCIKDWELGTRREQHTADDLEFEDAFENLYLDEQKALVVVFLLLVLELELLDDLVVVLVLVLVLLDDLLLDLDEDDLVLDLVARSPLGTTVRWGPIVLGPGRPDVVPGRPRHDGLAKGLTKPGFCAVTYPPDQRDETTRPRKQSTLPKWPQAAKPMHATVHIPRPPQPRLAATRRRVADVHVHVPDSDAMVACTAASRPHRVDAASRVPLRLGRTLESARSHSPTQSRRHTASATACLLRSRPPPELQTPEPAMDAIACVGVVAPPLLSRSFADAAIARALHFSLSDAAPVHDFGGGHPPPPPCVAAPSPSPSARCRLGPAGGHAGKRRRPRPSKRAPTTYISTDAATFRAMVQRVTGADDEAALLLHHQQDGLGLLLPQLGVEQFLQAGPAAHAAAAYATAQPAPAAAEQQPLFPTLDSWNVMYGKKNEVA